MSHYEGGPLLVIDAGSPRVSVAVGDADSVFAEASETRERSSATLLALIDAILGQAGLVQTDLAGMVALRGPGSFTGLRVGLATTLGLHQALGIPALGVPTLEILAAVGPGDGSRVVTVVDALRQEWFAQPFRSTDPPQKIAPPRLVSATELCDLAPSRIIGFGTDRLDGTPAAGARLVEPPPLAAVAVRRCARFPLPWDPATLVAPLYLRPPSARPPA